MINSPEASENVNIPPAPMGQAPSAPSLVGPGLSQAHLDLQRRLREEVRGINDISPSERNRAIARITRVFETEYCVRSDETYQALETVMALVENANQFQSELQRAGLDELSPHHQVNKKFLMKLRSLIDSEMSRFTALLDENQASSLPRQKAENASAIEATIEEKRLEIIGDNELLQIEVDSGERELLQRSIDEAEMKMEELRIQLDLQNAHFDSQIESATQNKRALGVQRAAIQRQLSPLLTIGRVIPARRVAPVREASEPTPAARVCIQADFAQSDDDRAQAEVFARILGPGSRINRLKAFILLDGETLDDYSKNSVLSKYQASFIDKGLMDVKAIAAIVTGYIFKAPNQGNHIAPLRDAQINPEREAAYLRLLDQIYSAIPELAPSRSGQAQAQSHSDSPLQSLQDQIQRAAGPRHVASNAPISSGTSPAHIEQPSLRHVAQEPSSEAARILNPSDNELERRRRAVNEIEERRREQDSEGFARDAHMINPHARGPQRLVMSAVEMAINEGLDEAQQSLLSQIIEPAVASGQLPRQLDVAAREIINQLQQKVLELETPDNLIKQGKMEAAFQMYKRKHGRLPTDREARKLISSNVPRKSQAPLLADIPRVLSLLG